MLLNSPKLPGTTNAITFHLPNKIKLLPCVVLIYDRVKICMAKEDHVDIVLLSAIFTMWELYPISWNIISCKISCKIYDFSFPSVAKLTPAVSARVKVTGYLWYVNNSTWASLHINHKHCMFNWHILFPVPVLIWVINICIYRYSCWFMVIQLSTNDWFDESSYHVYN